MIEELSDSEAAQAEEREAKTRADELDDDMRSVMDSKSGRRLVYDILSSFGAWDGVYSSRGAGRHEAAVELIVRVKRAGISAYHVMLSENEE